MAKKTGAELAEIVLERIRAQGGFAYSIDDVVKNLSRLQSFANLLLQAVTDSASLTTGKKQLVYNLRTDLPDAVRIISVKTSGGTTLRQTAHWKDLRDYNSAWFRQTGDAFLTWVQVGYRLLILYPALTSDSSVTVHYVKQLATLTKDAYPELPAQHYDFLLSLAEIVFLTRSRLLETAADKLETLSGAEVPEQ